jgi:hypothetical protein
MMRFARRRALTDDRERARGEKIMDPSFIGALRGMIAATSALVPTGTLSAADRALAPSSGRERAPARARRLLRLLEADDAWHEAAAGTGGAVG